jgi:hypothetical protein
MVFNTIIPRNIRLSESPSFGVPAIAHDSESKGAISYLNLAENSCEKWLCKSGVDWLRKCWTQQLLSRKTIYLFIGIITL